MNDTDGKDTILYLHWMNNCTFSGYEFLCSHAVLFIFMLQETKYFDPERGSGIAILRTSEFQVSVNEKM
jgi:hypothetical protein